MQITETGETVRRRTYARPKPDGSLETWPETVERVVDGNIALVDDPKLIENEREDLIRMMTEFKIIPAGRHLWASGVQGATHLMNCWASGWTSDPTEHFEFSFMRLMEGGGVGANYSNVPDYALRKSYNVHVVCSPEHPDYDDMKDAGLLSDEYCSEWVGSFEVEDSREGWADAVVDLIGTYFRDDVKNKNRVYDVSNVRAAGARLKTFGGTASGPAPLAKALKAISDVLNTRDRLSGMAAMEIDHALAECVVSGGVRRSARMAMMHWEDPEIFEFINCKKTGIGHWSTNISVVVDEEFWLAVRGDLSCPATTEHAGRVLDAISEGTLRNGEPGFWDISLSQKGEPGVLEVTNPCGEITLEAWEPCNLGHVNLAAFVDENGYADYADLALAHRLMTRFLIRATFAPVGDLKSRKVLDRNRRIGVGHLGVASFLAMTGQKYSDAPKSALFEEDLFLWKCSVDYAAEKYSHDLRIPVPVKKRTVAPTGTIAKMPGVSEGVHPIFSKYFLRRIRFSTVDPDQIRQVEEYKSKGYNVVDDIYADNTVVVEIPTKDILVDAVEARGFTEDVVEGADELTLQQMLDFQAMYQTDWADNAVSYTANVRAEDYTVETMREILLSYGGLLKGSTIFPEATMALAPYERMTREQYEYSIIQDVGDGVDEECAGGKGCPVR